MLQNLNWTTSGNTMAGDMNPGQGLSTGNKTVSIAVAADQGNIAGTQVLPQLVNHPVGGNAVTYWVAFLVLYLLYRWFTRNMKEDKLHLVEIGETTIEAILGLSVVHWFFARYEVPGVSALVKSA